jgi:DNA-binding XRE family transcriptional regulator
VFDFAPVTYPAYIREKARELRREKELTIDEIAQRLSVGRTTIYMWIHDMPRPSRAVSRQTPNQVLGTQAMQAKYKRLRDEAFELGHWEFPRMCRESTFRDFVCLYIGEGYKRDRNTVSLANSDPAAIALTVHWFRLCSRKMPRFSIQYHADQRLNDLHAFWAGQLSLPDLRIYFQRKSNSNQLTGRTWRCEFGVMTVAVSDTLFRARIQGWIERMQGQWLDSFRHGA